MKRIGKFGALGANPLALLPTPINQFAILWAQAQCADQLGKTELVGKAGSQRLARLSVMRIESPQQRHPLPGSFHTGEIGVATIRVSNSRHR